MNINEFTESMTCSECGGPAFSDLILAEKKDACYNKVRSRYKVWPSAYASGALVQCRKKGAANWGNKSEGVEEGLDQPREAGKAIQSLKNLAVMKSALTMQQLTQAGREAIVSNAINAAKTLEQKYLQNKQQGNAVFVRALRDEIDNFMRGAPINASFPESDNASELGDLLQGKLGKVNFQQGVAEGSREQVDPSTVWEVSFDYGPHQSDKVKVRASSQEEAEQKGMRAAKKLGHRFPQLNWAMPVEQGVAEGNPIDTDWYRKQQERQTKAKQRQHSVEEGEKIGNMDADDFDAAMARLKKLAGAGPMKTVYDPQKRVYRNMPTAQQPQKQDKK